MATEGDPGLRSGLGFPKAQPRAEHGEALELRVNSSGICVPFDHLESAFVTAAELIREYKCVRGKLGAVHSIIFFIRSWD